MRIGIITLPLHTNYGGILQAYALQTVLERMGHDVVVIDKRWRLDWGFKTRIQYYIKNFLKQILHKKCYRDYRQPNIYPKVSKYTEEFINQYIRKVHINSWIDLRETDFDAIVVGGDQIWRPKYLSYLMDSSPSNVFLDFATNWKIKRISYAPSFGTSDWEYTDHDTDSCRKLISIFNGVSVREIDGVELCKRHLNIIPEHVLDPTMLLSREDYVYLCESIRPSKGNLLIYLLDPSTELQSFIDVFVKNHGFIPFVVNSKVEDFTAPISERIQPPVEQWLRGFYDAEFVITDSFHACIFSMIFNKPFMVFGNKNRGIARLMSLLDTFNQSNRLFMDIPSEIPRFILESPNVEFSELKGKSIAFIKKSLEDKL